MGKLFENLALLLALESKIEELVAAITGAINAEKDAARREKMLDAYQRRDLAAMRELMFGA